MKRKHPDISCKRHYLLLEVLIAFILVALCVLPLISPHVFILKEQKEAIQKIDLDHIVNLVYADIIERLYKNEIPWSDLNSERSFPIDEALLHRIGWSKPIAYHGEYHFKVDKYKPKKQPAPYTLYLFDLTLGFLPHEIAKGGTDKQKEEQQIRYEYKIFVERNLEGDEGADQEPDKQEQPKDAKEGKSEKPPSK